MASPNVYAVIMAGGAGTRFWPASRAHRPKQLLPLHGESSLLKRTVDRIAPMIPPERVVIATNSLIEEAVKLDLPNVPAKNILAEPVPRNTAPCIGWATAFIARTDPNAIICVLPSDHAIGNEAEFLRIMKAAVDTAATGPITTIGIVPNRPETGYGYIEVGALLSEQALEVARFVEKPTLEKAQEYLESGKYLWNAGMFFFRAKAMLDAIRAHMPDLAAGLDEIDAAAKKGDEAAALAKVFPTLPPISIDYGVMEHEKKLAVIRGDFQWNDLGSWESAWELGEKDSANNVLPKGAVAIEASGNHVQRIGKGAHKTVALVGVSDLVIVETDDAFLVMPKSRAQDVRLVVEELKKRGDKHLL